MYRLTQRRLQKAQSILDEAFIFLVKTKGQAFPYDFERNLRNCWNIGYQELKDIMKDVLKEEKYKYLAVLYMEAGGECVVCEFQAPLAKVHGLKYFTRDGLLANRHKFWNKFIKKYCS